MRHAEWTEFALDKPIWTIPAKKTKMRREHQIFLARQAIDILNHLRTITGHRKLLFTAQQAAESKGRVNHAPITTRLQPESIR